MGTINLATLLVKLKADPKEYKKGMKSAKKESTGLGKHMKTAIAGGAAIAFALAANAVRKFVGDSIQEFKAFDEAIREVYTLLPAMNAAAMEQMNADVTEFTTNVGRTTDDVIPALYQAISAGVPADNVFDFMQTAHLAALGGVTDLQTAVDGITSVVNAYGESVVDAAMASDLMFTAVKGGKTDFKQLSSRLFQAVPIAAALGVEFGNVTAALAAMTAQGTPTRVAATQLRSVMVELSQAGAKTDLTFQRLAGMTFKEFIAEGGNLQTALQLLEQEAIDTDVGINDLFGSIEAGMAALTLTGKGTDKFASELANAETAAGATAEAADIMNESFMRVEEVAEATTEEFQIQIGEALAPAKTAWLELKTEVLGYATAVLKALTIGGKIERALEQHLELFTDNANVIRATEAEYRKIPSIMNEGADAIQVATDAWEGFSDEEIIAEKALQSILFPLDRTEAGAVDSEVAFERLAIALALLEGGLQPTTEQLDELISGFMRLDPIVRPELIAKYLEEVGILNLALHGESEALDILELKEIRAINRRQELARSVESYGQAVLNMSEDERAAERETIEEYTSSFAQRGEWQAKYEEWAAERARLATEEIEHEAQLAAAAEAHAARMGELTAAQDSYFASALPAIESTESLEAELFNAAKASGASMTQLALLGGALDLYDDKALEAALRTALISAKVEQLAKDYVAGTLSIGAMQSSLEGFIAGLDETAIHAAMTSEGIATVAGETEKLGQIPEPELPERFGAIEEAVITTATESAIALEDMAAATEENFGAMQDVVDIAMPAITATTSEEMKLTQNEIETEGAKVVKTHGDLYMEMWDEVERVMPLIVDETSMGIKLTRDEGRGWIPEFEDLGYDLIAGSAAGVVQGSPLLAHEVAAAIAAAVAAGRAAAGAQSPSQVMYEFGDDFIQGFINALEDREGDAITSMEGIVGGLLDLAGTFARAGSGIAREYERQVLDPLLDSIDGWTDTMTSIQDQFSDEFGLDISDLLESIGAEAGDLLGADDLISLKRKGYSQEERNALVNYNAALRSRNAAEAEYEAQQERLLELQRQQQQLGFLQTQLDLIRSLQEAGLDAGAIFEGMTLGLDANVSDMLDIMNAAMEALIASADEQLGIASASTVFAEKGKQIIAGLSRGILDAARLHLAGATDLALSYSTQTPVPTFSIPDVASSLGSASVGGTYSFQIDARGAAPGVEENIEESIRRVMEEFGLEADRIHRMGAY